MANPAPTINQINAFNATQGTTIDFNIIGGTELVRSNRIYIYDLSDNSLICTHLYVSTESIHELPANTDSSIVYESGKSSANFVNGAQYYAQIQTFTDIAGTEGGSGLSVAKMFWCLVDPTLTITTIPSTISTTSYNISATYNANTSVVSNIIQQYQFSLYSATGSLLQSSGVVVGSGTQQGTSTAYDISYNFSGLSVGSSYYVVVDITTTQGMSVTTQSNTFTVSIDTPTLGEATVVNNACDGYISVTSNLSSEYGGSGSGEIVSFETDSENVFTKLQVDLDPIQDLHGYDKPWVGGAGKNLFNASATTNLRDFSRNGETFTNTNTDTRSSVIFNVVYLANDSMVSVSNSITITETGRYSLVLNIPSGTDALRIRDSGSTRDLYFKYPFSGVGYYTISADFTSVNPTVAGGLVITNIQLEEGTTATAWTPYTNICPISGHDEVEVGVVGKNLFNVTATTQTVNGITFTVHDDGTVTVNGTATDQANLFLNANGANLVNGTSYIINGCPTGGSINAYGLWAKNDGIADYGSGETFTYDGSAIVGRIRIASGTVCNNLLFKPMVRIATESDATFAPYNGQTYTQEIEATYTPTVQENEPYQFKRTGDVGGDRESIELVGGSVAWNQLAEIVGFQSPLNGVTFTVNSDGSVTVNGTASGNARWSGFKAPAISGHVYYSQGCPSGGSDSTYRLYSSYTGVTLDRGSGRVVKHTSSTSYPDAQAEIFISSGYTANNLVFKPQYFDLTAMFGSTIADYIYSLEQSQAGAGVAWFKKYFPKPYYEYNAGELMSVNTSAHNTVGFNQFDIDSAELTAGNWSGNLTSTNVHTEGYTKVLPNTVYYMKTISTSGIYIRQYDTDKNDLNNQITKYNQSGFTFTTASDASYIRIMWYDINGVSVAEVENGDICINLSWDGERDGEYEAYVKHSYPLDSSLTLRGIPKLDASNNLYYDGDTYEPDGTVTRKYGIVDLGTLNWVYDSTNERFYTYGVEGAKNYFNAVCSKYPFVGGYYDLVDKSVAYIYYNKVCIKDSSYTDATAFKTAMSGVYLVYELATPTTESAEPFESIQKVTPNYGTEEFVTDSIVPVGNNTQYLTRDIYGGTLDLVSGELVIDRAMVTLNTANMDNSEEFPGWRSSGIRSLMGSGLNNVFNDVQTNVGRGIGVNTIGSNDVLMLLTGQYGLTQSEWKSLSMDVQMIIPLATPQTYQLTPQQIQTLIGQNNVWSEQGDIELAYHIPITNLLVKRQDVDDVSGDWLTLYSQPITQSSDMDFTFIDFTNQYGNTYKYALVPLLTQTQSGVEVEVEGGYTVSDEVQSVFDGVFIVDSTGSQKCKANVGYGNVDMNQTVGTITPIGAKYPVVITNSKNQYHNGSISGTIVPDDYYFNGNLSRIDMVNKRDELEQFLTNKRAKIIKDWNGKAWLVMIMDNVSCTFNNNYGMGIVNFSTNWIEVGDPTDQQDLQATGLINIGGV